MSIYARNDALFNQVRALNLPLGRYAITSSGPICYRDAREIGDIDLIVDEDIWKLLAAQFPVEQKDGFTRIKISEDIEVLGDGSNFTGNLGGPSTYEQIRNAEVLDGLAFVRLEDVLYFKRKMNRDKDRQDIALIEGLLGRSSSK